MRVVTELVCGLAIVLTRMPCLLCMVESKFPDFELQCVCNDEYIDKLVDIMCEKLKIYVLLFVWKFA